LCLSSLSTITMSSINKNVNVERRTWDKETYEARALSRATAEESSDLPHATDKKTDDEETPEEFQKASSERAGPMGSKRAFLKSRSNRVDLTSKLGSVEIIDPKAASNTGGITGNGVTKCSDGVGWHCRVCDCFLKDSLTYLDHINGKKHQRYLGYSMRVEKSTAEDVGSVLKGLAEKKSSEGNDIVESVDFEEVVKAREAEALQRKQERARRREERKKRARGEVVDGEQADGNTASDTPANDNPAEDNAEEDAAEVEEEEEEEEEEGIDPNLAAMMGFSGFGGSKKK
jgi:U4/U6.U5 tri-snRNP component SNU23